MWLDLQYDRVRIWLLASKQELVVADPIMLQFGHLMLKALLFCLDDSIQLITLLPNGPVVSKEAWMDQR